MNVYKYQKECWACGNVNDIYPFFYMGEKNGNFTDWDKMNINKIIDNHSGYDFSEHPLEVAKVNGLSLAKYDVYLKAGFNEEMKSTFSETMKQDYIGPVCRECDAVQGRILLVMILYLMLLIKILTSM